ncbi:MAG: hypothetical protein II035_04290 [Firmicutes bacterium]|nr:hypothetical protein [Bacillota bacterium]MEE3382367.1 glycerophosphodiester phosphodiesterase family protein [Anaerovoracaceae bacterium]MBQ1629819.1 hypothetical protein [Bacillota bacterium]MBQ1689776.1 hypothetical protein [Bacillota bacterium]MBQ1715557.1 hypothetical protein [Bacillota bacterium]
MEKTEIIEELKKHRYAHRGLFTKPTCPENSLMAFEKAAEMGFGIEFDVHLTCDAKLAVIHDSGLKRVTTVRADHRPVTPATASIPSDIKVGCSGIIEYMTLEEAKAFCLEESDQRIPEFREVLELIGGRVPLIIELKPRDGNHEELVDAVIREIEGYKGLYCVESFNSFAVLYLKNKYPHIVRGQLASDLMRDAASMKPNDPRERVKTDLGKSLMVRDMMMNPLTKPDFAAYNVLDRRNRAFRKYGGMKVIWTVKDPLDLEICEKTGATCIFEGFIPDGPLKKD